MEQLKLQQSAWILVVSILVTLVAALLSYEETLAEPDMVRMVAAVVYGGATGNSIFAGHHYGIKFSFGYYQLLYQLIPENRLQDPDYVARVVNNVGLVFTFGFALSLSLMLNKLLEQRVAVFCSVSFLFCPVVLTFLASAHPMIAASAFLFLGCWLILRSREKNNTEAVVSHFAVAFISLIVSLCFRGEIALAFPFIAVAYFVNAKKSAPSVLLQGTVVCLILVLAFTCFLLLQKPFVASEGGAINSLATFLAKAASKERITRGFAVLMLAIGIVTALLLSFTLVFRVIDRKINVALTFVCLTLALPSLLFWLPTPQPARHFVIAILGLYLLLGQFWANKFSNIQHALGMALLLALGNQITAELVHPIIVKHYQWSYNANGLRRATQQVPLGFVLFDQQANKTTESILRHESIQLAAKKPKKLVIMANTQYYIIARLLAQDLSLRLILQQIGHFKALLLANSYKKIYLIEEKYVFWPKDILSEILSMSKLASYPIYVQPTTLSRYDKTPMPEERKYNTE